jgi:hypothetical protein
MTMHANVCSHLVRSHQCVERRWGDVDAATYADGALKRFWYEAEQTLRNLLERTYDAQTDFTLSQLQARRPGTAAAPDTDVRGYLLRAGAQPDNAP